MEAPERFSDLNEETRRFLSTLGVDDLEDLKGLIDVWKNSARYHDVDPNTRKFISDLSGSDLQDIKKAVKFWRLVGVVVHAVVWFIGGLVAFLVPSWEFTKAIGEFLVWWKTGGSK